MAEGTQQEEDDDGEEYEGWNYFPGLGVQLGNCLVSSWCSSRRLWLCPVHLRWGETPPTTCHREFQTFEDKASAINLDTGVNERLAKTIKVHIKHDQKLAVGSLEYKEIIEENLGISCLHDGIVMEVMWGLKNCRHCLVPGEFAKDDRPLMSEGMKIVLDKYHFD
ncbi:hypothetical protein BAE44_0000546 [Dichanthelium oligosanthes]|uniref:Uncharacterized protein n=1 Tax=Dichanthelium oligosanthes TaxID=888268 RepID=A0A1E5WM06_9POAL|nr:hypothetical protein BAE44_0000546 [Dichanthelium oligosanthes]